MKLGGTLLDSSQSAAACTELAAVQRSGAELVVVHEGGRQMTRFLTERGVEAASSMGLE
ncbi:MAG: hypothetical protein WKF37_08595 [Bryobacteraceae bacterium]